MRAPSVVIHRTTSHRRLFLAWHTHRPRRRIACPAGWKSGRLSGLCQVGRCARCATRASSTPCSCTSSRGSPARPPHRRRPARAEEITQDAFVELLRHWRTVAAYDRPDLWLRRVAIRKAQRERRRGWRCPRARGPRRPAPRGGSPADPGTRGPRGRTPTRSRPARGRRALLPRGPAHGRDRGHPRHPASPPVGASSTPPASTWPLALRSEVSDAIDIDDLLRARLRASRATPEWSRPEPRSGRWSAGTGARLRPDAAWRSNRAGSGGRGGVARPARLHPRRVASNRPPRPPRPRRPPLPRPPHRWKAGGSPLLWWRPMCGPRPAAGAPGVAATMLGRPPPRPLPDDRR